MSKEKRDARIAAKAEQDKVKVKMRFSEDKFYNDVNTPLYHKGEVYEIQGADMINRWIKRGGEIVTDEMLKEESKAKAKSKVEESKSEKNEESVVTKQEKEEDKSKPELSTKQKSK